MSGTSLFPASSPGVYQQEKDVSQQTNGVATSIGVIVAASRKGPIGPTLVTNGDQLNFLYGPSDPGWSFLQLSALPFLMESQVLWVNRIINTDCTYAGMTLENDFAGPSGNASRLIASNGTVGDYSTGGQDVYHIALDNALQTGNTFNLTLGNGTTSQSLSISFATSNDATIGNILLAINDILADFNLVGLGAGSATAFAPLSNQPTGATLTVIRIVAPEGVSLNLTSNVTGGSNVVNALVQSPALLTFFAQNPGAWGNKLGITISNINEGTSDQLTLTFSTAITSGNVIQLTFNVAGAVYNIPPVSFGTSNDATLAALANQIEATIPGADAFITPVNGQSSNFRRLTVVSPLTGPGTISMTNSANTVGPIVSSSTAVTGVAGEDTFQINVFLQPNVNTPVESFVVSLNHQLDGNGFQQFVEEVINNSANASSYVRVVYDPDLGGTVFSNGLSATNITWFQGGNDGSLPTNSQIVTGWQAFSDPESYDIDILINAGYTAPVVAQTMASIATNRKDCFAILDMPSNVQTTQLALNYRQNTLNVNTSYASIYTPDLQVTDLISDRLVYMPPSGAVAARYAFTDRNFAVWFAPAGLTRGVVQNVQGLRVKYLKGDRDVLDPAQVNCLRQFRDGSGIAIWGVNTLQTTSSLLSFNSVRRMLTYCQKSIVRSLEGKVFDNITAQTQFLMVQELNAFLQPIKNSDGLHDFLVLCDGRNNPAPITDAGQLNITVYFVPNPPARVIVLSSVVTPQTISFTELIAQNVF